jgi:hypothetical protein
MPKSLLIIHCEGRPSLGLDEDVISQFSNAYYSKGIHVNVFKHCILANFEVVFLVIWSFLNLGTF